MSAEYQPIGRMPETVRGRAAAILAQDVHGRILCQLRDDFEGVAAPGKWCLFGGQVEAGETLLEAASREFLEETGLGHYRSDFTPLAKIASAVKPDWEICILKLTPTVDPAQVRLGEGAGFAFLTPAQIARMDFIGNYPQFFEHFFA